MTYVFFYARVNYCLPTMLAGLEKYMYWPFLYLADMINPCEPLAFEGISIAWYLI